MAFDPDVFLAEPAPAKPFDPDAFLAGRGAAEAPPTAPAPAAPPSFMDRAKKFGGSIVDDVAGFGRGVAAGAKQIITDPVGAAKDFGSGVVAGTKGIYDTVKGTADTINQVVDHPVATLGDQRFRTEFMRGVNDNIPLANRAVEMVGGPTADSPTDAAAFPNARAAGNVAGLALPVGEVAGAVAGRAVEGAGKVATKISAKAENRMVDQAVKDIGGSKAQMVSSETDRRVLAEAIKPLKEELRQPGATAITDTARKDPAKAWEMIQERVNGMTSERASAYKAIDDATNGVHVGDLRRHLGDEVKRLGKSPGQATERGAIEAMIKDIDETWGSNVTPTVPTIEMRQYVTRLQRTAADTMGGLEETRRVQILDHVSGVAKEFLDKHLDEAAKLDPKLAETVADLRTMNRRVSAWLSAEDALKTRASKISTNQFIDGKKTFLAGALGAASGALHYLHTPALAVGVAAAGAAPYVAPVVDRAVTRRAIRLPGLVPDPSAAAGVASKAGSAAQAVGAARNLTAGRNALRAMAGDNSPSGVTELSPAEEKDYQKWKATLPQRLQYEGNYDLRGFFKKNPGWSPDAPEAHMTDEFKLPNHPTFSDESKYFNERTKHLAGHWNGASYIPFDTRFKSRVDE